MGKYECQIPTWSRVFSSLLDHGLNCRAHSILKQIPLLLLIESTPFEMPALSCGCPPWLKEFPLVHMQMLPGNDDFAPALWLRTNRPTPYAHVCVSDCADSSWVESRMFGSGKDVPFNYANRDKVSVLQGFRASQQKARKRRRR